MSNSKHTPGPWIADFIDGRCRAIYEDRKIFPVCYFDPMLNKDYSVESGYLIAAAPDLLAVLHDCANAIGEIFYPLDHPALRILDRANAAIAKAEGRAS